MNADVFKGKWKQIRGRAKQAWSELSDDDLTRVDGDYDRLIGTLQEKYGYTKAEAQAKIDELLGDD